MVVWIILRVYMYVFLQVLRCLKEKLPSPVVQAFVLDFEKGKIHTY